MARPPPPSVVKVVLFDVGGVLFSPPQTAIAEVEQEHGLPLGTLFRVFVSGEPNNAFCRLERGELTLSQFFPVFEREVEGEVESRGVTLAGSSVQEDLQYRFKTGVIRIDDTSDQSNQFMTSFLNGHFDLVLQSCQLGIRKPNPLIYRLACHRFGVQPSEVVFLDDLGRNVRSAREVGMTAVRVRETEEALRELETLLGTDKLVERLPTTAQTTGVKSLL